MSGPPDLQPFVPENPLEQAILDAAEGRKTRTEMLKWLCHSTVMVASVQPVAQDMSGFKPLLMGNAELPLVSIFTAPVRQALYADVATHVVSMLGGDYIQQLPRTHGLAVNPGSQAQFAILPVEMEEIRAKLQYGLI